VVGALQLQVERASTEEAADRRPAGDLRPGENAGVVDIGDGQACHLQDGEPQPPVYIEPYQGAATGVGGILRDVFTMGARPIANMNALRFGAPITPRCATWWRRRPGHRRLWQLRRRADRGGEVNFHPAYDGNILVNAMTVGVADTTRSSIRRLRRRQPDRLCRLQDRARRHPRRDDGVRRFR
jgi:phosphoribosylformylglycinamidine (FGAM) synthase-like enzyme